MERRQFIAASSIGLTATMAGCVGRSLGSDGAESDDSESNTGASSTDGEITVSADGDIEVEPDQAVISVGVEARGESADVVTNDLATGADSLRTAFDDLGIPDENVDEGQYRVYPARGRDADGFEGSHTFEVTISDVDRVGEVIDTVVEAGADNVGHVRFTLRPETRTERRADAIDNALANADAEASHIATNRNVSLEGTTAVKTGDVNVQPYRHELEAGGDAATGGAPPTEIDAEPVTVSASMTVTYAFTAQ
ncbi:SIMPL domain-containing protein [Haloarchaeobius amylolyticus]|uniref:SIMPL domain-containing protein n=1 Tax=Haloarchaeobius amylolyticus TaxID=1198296 RepID=A0ABD6BKT0_9EURY